MTDPHEPPHMLPIPGFGRRLHETHMVLAGLAALDDDDAREMYGALRAAYNPCRPRGTSPAPPLGEWEGMSSFCENLYCRYVFTCSRPVIPLRTWNGAECPFGNDLETLHRWPLFSDVRVLCSVLTRRIVSTIVWTQTLCGLNTTPRQSRDETLVVR